MPEPFQIRDGSLRLSVRVAPGASNNRIEGLYRAADRSCALKVRVTAVPDKGRANTAIIATLAKALKMPKSAFLLVSGAASRNKTFEIFGETDQVICALRSMINTYDTGG